MNGFERNSVENACLMFYLYSFIDHRCFSCNIQNMRAACEVTMADSPHVVASAIVTERTMIWGRIYKSV